MVLSEKMWFCDTEWEISHVSEIDGASLRTLVNFAYSGSIDFSTYSPQTLWPLLSACSLLEMRDALQLCHKYMEDSISGAQPATVSSSQVCNCNCLQNVLEH